MTQRNTIRGGPELQRHLAAIGAAASGKLLERALLGGALEIVNPAKENAPYKTGNLRRSIHVGGYGAAGGLGQEPDGGSGPTTGADIGGRQSTATSATVLVGTNVDYAKPIEYGAGKRAARPFLRPALDEHREDALGAMGVALHAQIRAAAR